MKLFNQYSSQLDNVHDQQLNDFDKIGVDNINSLLENIANLNETIKEDQLYGNPSLELKDQRNAMLDELSQYVDINITYTQVKVADGVYVDEVSVTLASDPNIKLVDDNEFGKISRNPGFPKTDDTLKVNLKYPHDTGTETEISDDIEGGSLKGYLTMFNSKGAYDTPASDDRGFGYYESMLDSMASEFAGMFNEANGTDKPLFEANDGSGVIDASNISIADGWMNGDYGITNSKDPDAGPGQNDNILHMITLFDKEITFKGGDDSTVFTGTFEEFFSNISTTLGAEKNSTEKLFKNYYSVLTGLADSKASVSSVSLDEEGMNMIKYQQSYNAAARLMTTLDEALDTIINKMGVVGR